MGTWTIVLTDETPALESAPSYELGRVFASLAAEFLNDGGPAELLLTDTNGIAIGGISYRPKDGNHG